MNAPLAVAIPEQVGSPEVTITSLSPEVISPGEDLQVTILIQGTEEELAGWSVARVFIQPSPLQSSSQIDEYLSGTEFPGWPSAWYGKDELVQEPLPDGSGIQAEIAVDAADLLPYDQAISTSTLGLTVRLSNAGTETEARTLFIYDSGEASPKTMINVLGFDLSTASDSAESSGTPDITALNQAAELANIPGVSLAVLPEFFGDFQMTSAAESETSDMSVVTEPALPSATPTPSLSPVDTEASSFTQALTLDRWTQSFYAHRDLILQSSINLVLLPAADANLPLLAATGQQDLLGFALKTREIDRSAAAFEHLQTMKATLVDNVVIADEVGFTLQALDALRGNSIIAPNSYSLLDYDPSGLTPTSRLLIDVANGQIRSSFSYGSATAAEGKFATPQISERDSSAITVLDCWDSAMEVINLPVGSPAEELEIRQTLRALSLAVGQEDPFDLRILLVSLDVSRETSSPAIVERVRALLDNQWVTPASFKTVASSPASIVQRVPIQNLSVSSDRSLRQALEQIRPLAEALQKASAIAQATALGPALLIPYQESLLIPVGRLVQPDKRDQLVATAVDQLSSITSTVEILPEGIVNVINRNSNFPVTVMNHGVNDISLEITIQPNDSRLQAKSSVPVIVPAGKQLKVTVPIVAVGSGDVGVYLQAMTPSGEIIDESPEIMVRVRADWEDAGTIVFSAGLLFLFLFGVIRTIIKGRRRNRQLSTVEATQPDSTGEEVGETK